MGQIKRFLNTVGHLMRISHTFVYAFLLKKKEKMLLILTKEIRKIQYTTDQLIKIQNCVKLWFENFILK